MVALLLLAIVPVVSLYQSGVACARVSEAQAYCDRLMPRLEAVKARTGSYPQTLEGVLLPNEPLPGLLQEPSNKDWYESSGQEYGFFIHPDEGGPLAFVFCAELHAYKSSLGQWGISTG